MPKDPAVVALEANTKALIANTKAFENNTQMRARFVKILEVLNENLVKHAKTLKEEKTKEVDEDSPLQT